MRLRQRLKQQPGGRHAARHGASIALRPCCLPLTPFSPTKAFQAPPPPAAILFLLSFLFIPHPETRERLPQQQQLLSQGGSGTVSSSPSTSFLPPGCPAALPKRRLLSDVCLQTQQRRDFRALSGGKGRRTQSTHELPGGISVPQQPLGYTAAPGLCILWSARSPNAERQPLLKGATSPSSSGAGPPRSSAGTGRGVRHLERRGSSRGEQCSSPLPARPRRSWNCSLLGEVFKLNTD